MKIRRKNVKIKKDLIIGIICLLGIFCSGIKYNNYSVNRAEKIGACIVYYFDLNYETTKYFCSCFVDSDPKDTNEAVVFSASCAEKTFKKFNIPTPDPNENNI